MARPGEARHGAARQGKGYNVAYSVSIGALCDALGTWLGSARHGQARRGEARGQWPIEETTMTDDTKNQTHYPWNEGMPTKPDVDLLMKTWPEIKVGDEFEYSAIESLIGTDRGASKSSENRFKTVTKAWRRRLEEKGVVLECADGERFYAASSEQVSAGTCGDLQSIGRKARRRRKKLCAVAVESDEQRGIVMHQSRLLLEIERGAKKSRMNLLPSTKSDETPRISPLQKRDGNGNE